MSPRDTREGYNYIQPPEPCSQRGPTKKRGKKGKKKQKGVSLASVSAEGGLHCCMSFLSQKPNCLYPDPPSCKCNQISAPGTGHDEVGKKKEKPVTELAVVAVVSQNQRK